MVTESMCFKLLTLKLKVTRLWFPVFKMTEDELLNFIQALHFDDSSSYFCNKTTVYSSTKRKLEKIFGGHGPIALEQAVNSPMTILLKKDSHYALRCKWVTRLLRYNMAPREYKKLHKRLMKAPHRAVRLKRRG